MNKRTQEGLWRRGPVVRAESPRASYGAGLILLQAQAGGDPASFTGSGPGPQVGDGDGSRWTFGSTCSHDWRRRTADENWGSLSARGC